MVISVAIHKIFSIVEIIKTVVYILNAKVNHSIHIIHVDLVNFERHKFKEP